MKDFKGKIAAITGAGSGMGRELARQLVKEGCHVALCDISADQLAESKKLCDDESADDVRVTTHECDVSDEKAVLAFRDATLAEHETQHVNLVFNNAGIGGGGSIVSGDRAEWEKTFDVCWGGVYFGTRAFMPALVASDDGYIINTSSINGFWASLGPDIAHTAYSAAKFAVKGFTEALVTDLRLNAPHVKAAVVMPGHIGTSIVMNSRRILGHGTAEQMTTEELEQMRTMMVARGLPAEQIPDSAIRAFMHQRMLDFQDKAPTTAAAAATVILDGVRAEKWRILVGDDAFALDEKVRGNPEGAYEREFVEDLHAEDQLQELVPNMGDVPSE